MNLRTGNEADAQQVDYLVAFGPLSADDIVRGKLRNKWGIISRVMDEQVPGASGHLNILLAYISRLFIVISQAEIWVILKIFWLPMPL